MSAVIRVLESDLADQIAAGEVVERPASVAKELVENALDAGARTVRVESERGGTVRLAVSDDGCGMSPEDVRLAVRRHATSKISAVGDLRAIASFGFRGEALPSIAAVSRFTLTTRRREDAAAVRLEVLGGAEARVREVAAPAGTTVEVEDLFYNVPARRKFLKRVQTEASRLVDACARLALARPDVAFSVTEDGRKRLDAPRVRGLSDRAAAVLGLKTATALVGIDRRGSVVHVRGLVSPPTLSRSNTGGVYLFVNGRYVKDRAVQGALLAAYRGLLDKGRFPIAVLFVDLDPAEVDVNVHPAKHEVRFARQAAVTGSVVEAVRGALASARWVGRPGPPVDAGGGGGRPGVPERVVRIGPAPGVAGPEGDPAKPFAEAAARLRGAVERVRGERQLGQPEPAPSGGLSSATCPLPGAGGEGRGAWFSALRVLGSAGGTFIVCEGREGLVLIDQHAAHERVTFERLRTSLAEGRVPVQPFLVPLRVDLTPGQARALEADGERLDRLGLETEPFGGSSVLLKTVPAPLVGGDGAGLLCDLLDELAGDGDGPPCGGPLALSDKLEALAATLACHGSVRAGQTLSSEEVKALLRALDEVEFPGNCPHGRPTVVELPYVELRRRFRRT